MLSHKWASSARPVDHGAVLGNGGAVAGRGGALLTISRSLGCFGALTIGKHAGAWRRVSWALGHGPLHDAPAAAVQTASGENEGFESVLSGRQRL